MEAPADNLIAVGRIAGTHGIRGQLRLHSYSGNIESLQSAGHAMLRAPNGECRQIRISRAAQHGSKILLTLQDFDNINQVLHLVGHELLLERDQLPEPADDEYYWHDLIGLTVVTVEGLQLGSLEDVMETGANDVYLVKNRQTGQEYLIPAIASVVSSIDLRAGTMIITPLEGLLDL